MSKLNLHKILNKLTIYSKIATIRLIKINNKLIN